MSINLFNLCFSDCFMYLLLFIAYRALFAAYSAMYLFYDFVIVKRATVCETRSVYDVAMAMYIRSSVREGQSIPYRPAN